MKSVRKNKAVKSTRKTVLKNMLCQQWEESERGWGARPDGYSLHLTQKDLDSYVKSYWDAMPNEVPEEYSRPCGKPYLVKVGDKKFKEIKKSKNGIRIYEPAPAGVGLGRP